MSVATGEPGAKVLQERIPSGRGIAGHVVDKGEPVHVVANRAGHDPVTLLGSYRSMDQEDGRQRGEKIASMSRGME